MSNKTLIIVLGATAAVGVLYFLHKKKSAPAAPPANTAFTTSGAPVNSTTTDSLTGLMNSGSPQNTSPVINSPYGGTTGGGYTTDMPGVKLYVPTIN